VSALEALVALVTWTLSDLRHSLGLAAILLAIGGIVFASRVGNGGDDR
jgi:hypothetical protein